MNTLYKPKFLLFICLRCDPSVEEWLTVPTQYLRSHTRIETQLIRLTSIELVLESWAPLLAKIPNWLALFPALTSDHYGGDDSPQQKTANLVKDIGVMGLNVDLQRSFTEFTPEPVRS